MITPVMIFFTVLYFDTLRMAYAPPPNRNGTHGPRTVEAIFREIVERAVRRREAEE